MTHTCPVCGFDRLPEPHVDMTGEPTYSICPACGTQFGADDLQHTHAELRAQWVKSGAQWWSETSTPPEGWSAEAQITAAFGEEEG
jgi:hypothetical protein